MVKFKNCLFELQLESQSPMIHFQWYQDGASIRASEVKPKLDRFLLDKISKVMRMKEDGLKSDEVWKRIFICNEQDALNYKMAIKSNSSPVVINLDKKYSSFDIFYGNSGKAEHEKIRGVYSNPLITILCFQKELRKLIEDNIIEFFLVTNFGIMQNKGFGSFLPTECRFDKQLGVKEIQRIGEYLKERAGALHCYTMKFKNVPIRVTGSEAQVNYNAMVFKEIKSFYGIMKSGQNFNGYARSYLFQYMHKNKIDNEKAWMKQNEISPSLQSTERDKKNNILDNNPKYVRALLGTGQMISFAKSLVKKKDSFGNIKYVPSKEKIDINIKSIEEDEIERVSSPIFFKIIKNVVFIVSFPVSDKIFNKEFEFSGVMGKGRITTPSEFNIQEFLENYICYYNKELPYKLSNISKKVTKI